MLILVYIYFTDDDSGDGVISTSIGTGSPKCDPGPGDPEQVLTR